MLLSITERCLMGCKHCMDNATPEGNDMDMVTFENAISFFNTYGGIELIITGGEPTENPYWIKMFQYAISNVTGSSGLNKFAHVTLTTNGMNYLHNKDMQTYLMSLYDRYRNFTIQITHVDGLYPIDVDLSDPFFDSSFIQICDKIEAMYPLGRARENNLPYQSKCSKCFNIRSAVRAHKDLNKATILLAMNAKFCTPRINWNGDIKLGESRLCPTVANIYDTHEDIVKAICAFKCSECNIINDKLPDVYKEAIGELP